MQKYKTRLSLIVGSVMAGTLFSQNQALLAAELIEEIQVVGVTPGAVSTRDINKVPFAVQNTNLADLEAAQSLDLSDFMNSRLTSVNINSAQNNPLQPDVQFRGFTASPLLGLPQGLAVFQNGVRVNEAIGDSVNWDLIPESAVYSMDLISGSNPVFGLNTLGGALAINMKNGFNFEQTQIEAYSGSWGRQVINAESGNNFTLGNGSDWGYYLNVSSFDEDGWRDLSKSEAINFYGAISWRDAENSTLDLIYQNGDSELIGNGALPLGMLSIDRTSIFTAPDITENDMQMVNLQGSHYFAEGLQFSGNIFWRENATNSFNGDGSEFELCEYSGGGQSLFEEADEIEDALEDELGIELDDICEGGDPSISSFDDLEDLIEQEALLAALDAEDFELEDVIDDLSGTGIITDEAISNISQSVQKLQGFNAQLAFEDAFFTSPNQFIIGANYLQGQSDFSSVLELAFLHPLTRSTQGLGTGTFFDEAETNIFTETETWSVFFTNTIDVNEQLSVTLAGRLNDTNITLRDRSGERPELNGDHSFTRFNPSLGFTYSAVNTGAGNNTHFYGSYSESNRVPTPIELSCNEGVFEVAQQFAILDGEDPDDIEFECRLPNAFLADPPLEDVVTKSFELGVRGQWQDINYQLGIFNADNKDDIIFQTTGRSTGLFDNVDNTRRRGFESAIQGSTEAIDWYASFTYLQVTFEDNFMVLGPNHPSANAEGEVLVEKGDRIPGLPESIFKVGGDYHLNENLSLGLDAIYNSDQVIRGDESNDLDKVEGYALVNLRANYNIGEQLSVFARVTNVFDKDYENFGLLGEDPSEILPMLSNNSPVFLGIGAPRGAWLGLRYKF